MKGISPLVAVVLLIAFTVGIGGLVSLFATSLTTTSTSIVSRQTEAQTKCAGAWINVYRVTNSSVFYSNPSSEIIRNITIIPESGGTINGSTSLSPGQTNATSWTAGTNGSVIVRGLCQIIVPIEGSCRSGQLCWVV